METIAPVLDLRSLAATLRAKFPLGKRMIVRNSKVTHAVDPERWVAGELIPQPLCHTATYGWSPSAYTPTDGPITCMKCRRKLASPEEILLPYGTYQPPLFSLVENNITRTGGRRAAA